MKDITIEEAVKMLDKFITEHKFYNIKQSDGLEDNIEKVLNELEKKDKIINAMAKFIDTELSSEHLTRVLKKEVLPLKTYREDIKQYFERKIEDD